MVAMEARRGRRFGRGPNQTLLPLRVTHQSNTVSCWYCDFKISFFNEPLFAFGRRHARCLRVWFSVGIGFSLAALLGVTMILLWELAIALHLYNGNTRFSRLLTGSLFGLSPSALGLSVSVADVGYLLISTIISVTAHEFGHALSAASEGIQIEYVAVFLAVIFPGALVAFNYELLKAIPRFAALRIYCAGVWHNAAGCAVCGLLLCLLPLILYPFYVNGESPMVLDVSSSSPLSGYLSPGDLIISLDGMRIHNVQEWMEMASLLDEQALQNSNSSNDFNRFMTVNGRKGYCVPSPLMEESKDIQLINNGSICPNELTAFVTISCFDPIDGSGEDDHQKSRESIHCLTAKDIVKLKKCGDGWMKSISNSSSCPCSEDEYCLSPVKMPGLTWVEITYSSPYSSECRFEKNPFPGLENSDFGGMNCGGTFVFIGDVISMAHSIRLTAYRPRWSFAFGAYFPDVLEKILMCTFQVSLTLALLNSLPMYFLDGESILEVALCYVSLLSPRQRRTVLQLCLLGGTLMSVLAFLRIFLYKF
ncbi:membrane-bound transcription factor site-2 protease homolog [Cornus florida]|uniref:membrane-bound transcription factor site-2 protease homolog n=1 Tax=Cornus florida TaxID=4283 RepID=UPI00289DEFA5|nr:membrane-bound transcription factor site-2 protease homolog [Cornus florida]